MGYKSSKLNFYLSALLFLALFVGMAMPARVAQAATITTVVTPLSPDWGFVNDNGTVGDWSTGFVSGPATAPLGLGSVNINLTSIGAGIVFGTQKYMGTKLSAITALSYSTYTNLSPAAMTFQINYDPDVTTVEGTWYGRLTYEPYINGTVTNSTWQTWDMINGSNGKWWASSNGNSTVDDVGNCPQGSPCTLNTLLTKFPNIGIRNDANTGIWFKAGSNWNGFIGNVDKLSITIGANTDIYDFEPYSTTTTITIDTPDPSAISQNVSVTATVAAPAGAPTPTGTVTISGGVANCTTPALVAGTGSCTITFSTAGAKTITATYNPDTVNFATSSDTEPHTVGAATFTVTFNANGGTGAMVSQTASVATNLTSNTFTKVGYTFTGWNTAANGSGTAYANNASYPFTASVTLYAQWSIDVIATPIFSDVPFSHWASGYIERLYRYGITSGCGTNPLIYCPDGKATRAEMAIFILRAKYNTPFVSYTPPAVGTSTGFADVPVGAFADAWIKQLAVEGITVGCGGGNYCPNANITRAEMAIFLLRGKYGSAYNPPVATGTVFSDVPLTSFAAAWIEQLAKEGITSGCGAGKFCPSSPVTRAEMAVFLVKAFGLP